MARFGTVGTRYLDDAGNPLVSGLLYFYESGTTTLKTTYADENSTVANTNPVVLDADGLQPDIFFTGTAKIILTDSSYVQVDQRDPVGGASGTQLSDWSVTAVYDSNAFVIGSDGEVYKSQSTANQGNDPTADDGSNWSLIKATTFWRNTITFDADDIVQGSDGYLYVSVIASNLNNDPITDDGTNWKRSSKSEYEVGDVALSADETRFTAPTWLPCDSNSYNTTTYADLYARLGNVQVDGLIADPATPPPAYARDLSFSLDNNYLAVSHGTSPYITIYSRSGDTFTKVTNPSSLPSTVSYCCEYDPTGIYLAAGHSSSPYITIYKRSGDTHTKLTNPATLPTGAVLDVSWDSTSTYLAVAHSGSPYVTIYKRSGDTFTKLTNPVTLPASTGNSCDFDSTDTYLAVGHASSPFITIYKRSGDTFTKLDDPATLPTGTGIDVEWNGTTLVVNDSGTSIDFYSLSGDVLTSFDPEIANYLPTSGAQRIAFSRDGRYFMVIGTSNPWGYVLFSVVGDSYIKAELDTTKDVNDNYYAVEFGDDDGYMVLGDTNSPYLTFFKGMPLTPKVTADENGQVRGYINTGL